MRSTSTPAALAYRPRIGLELLRQLLPFSKIRIQPPARLTRSASHKPGQSPSISAASSFQKSSPIR